MKKKYGIPDKDKKDWITFTKELPNIYDKEYHPGDKNINKEKVKKLDLHGLKLDEANEVVKNFIIESFEKNFKKLIIVTGKGLRSKVKDDPYKSEEMNVLRYSIPNFIQNNLILREKISKITKALLKDGGDGAIYIFLKKNKIKE